MKDTLLEALMRLFDECLSKRQNAPNQDTSVPKHELFPLNWGELSHIEKNTYFIRPANLQSKRVFSSEEMIKLTKKSYQFLEQLIQLDLIGEHTLELIINQLLFSHSPFVHLDETKWIVQQTLADSLNTNELAFLNLVLYEKEEGARQH